MGTTAKSAEYPKALGIEEQPESSEEQLELEEQPESSEFIYRSLPGGYQIGDKVKWIMKDFEHVRDPIKKGGEGTVKGRHDAERFVVQFEYGSRVAVLPREVSKM